VQHAEPAAARSGFISRRSLGGGPLLRQRDDRVELRVDPVDPVQERVKQLTGRQLPGVQQPRQFNGGHEAKVIVHIR
jgi:hypothetical protein